jgi:apolipoprotein N-acyltransferase
MRDMVEASERAYPRLLRASTARCATLAALALASGFGLASAHGGGASPAVAVAAWVPALGATPFARPREAFGVGFGAGLVGALGALGFLFTASSRYLESNLWGGLAVVGVAIALALPLGAALALGSYVGRSRGLEALAAALALTLAERFVPSPLPSPIGTALVEWSGLAEGAATFTVYGLSLVVHLAAAGIATALAALAVRGGWSGSTSRGASATGLAALIALAALAFAGRLRDASASGSAPTVRVHVIGAPIAEGRKSAPPADPDVSLVVAPEAAFDGVAETADAAGLARAMLGAGPPVLLGATVRERGRLHNRAILSDEAGHAAAWVDKSELLPIAERTLDEATSYTWSPSDGLLRVSERRSGAELGLGVTVCYESLFPARVGAAAEGADLLVNLANDRWFEDHRPSEAQVRALRARALETGLTTLRVARSGPSVLIDARGRELARVQAGSSAILELPLERRPTASRQLGAARDLPWLALTAAVGALAGGVSRRRREHERAVRGL